MTWTGPPPFIVGSSTNPPVVWSGIAYTVLRSMAEYRFEVKTNFTSPGPQPEGIAENAPTYSHTFEAPILTVYWGPTKTYAIPIKNTYEVGDTLTCFTDAYPEPTYRWQNMRTLEEFDVQEFTITSDNIFIPTYVPIVTTPTTTPSTPVPTMPPPVSQCRDFTGYWISEVPYAELLLQMDDDSQIGEVKGIFKNRTDTI